MKQKTNIGKLSRDQYRPVVNVRREYLIWR